MRMQKKWQAMILGNSESDLGNSVSDLGSSICTCDPWVFRVISNPVERIR